MKKLIILAFAISSLSAFAGPRFNGASTAIGIGAPQSLLVSGTPKPKKADGYCTRKNVSVTVACSSFDEKTCTNATNADYCTWKKRASSTD